MDIINMPLTAGSSQQTPNRVVVHCMAEYLRGDPDRHVHAFLKDIGLSAHALVTPSGSVIRCRKDSQGAYHAKNHNANSLGIEFLVPGCHDYGTFKEAIKTPYLTEPQYDAGLRQIKEWMRLWHIGNIQRHSDIDPERKIDPGHGFPWEKLLSDIRS